MISGSAGPGSTNTNPYSGIRMTTLSGLVQMGDVDLLGSRDGIVPVANTGQRDSVRKVIAKVGFTNQFKKSWKGLQRGLVARGMTPLFPEELAGPLADPIVGSTGNRVYPLTFDLDGLSKKKSGSPLMFAAFARGMSEAAELHDYISIEQYMDIVTRAFTVDPGALTGWHVDASGINPYVSGRELKPDVQYVANIVAGAKLLRLKKGKPGMWRVILPDAFTESAVKNVDEALVAALKGFQTDLPTVVDVLDAAVKVFKKGDNKADNGKRFNPFEVSAAIVSGTIHRV